MARTRLIFFSGVDEVRRRVRALEEAGLKAVGAALYQEGERIMGESKLEVPVDLGTLHDTGSVDAPQVESGRVSVQLGFGGPSAPYALVQHENKEYQHRGRGKAKYLEDPMTRAMPRLARKVGSDVGAELVRVGTKGTSRRRLS